MKRSGTITHSDVYINGMALPDASNLRGDRALRSTIDFVLGQVMPDRLDSGAAAIASARAGPGVVAAHYPRHTKPPTELAGRPSRWAPLTAERVLRTYGGFGESGRPAGSGVR